MEEEREVKGREAPGRRRMVERGSDRLALITGRRVQTLEENSLIPSPSSSSCTTSRFRYAHTQSSPALLSLDDQPTLLNNVGLEGNYDASGASIKHEIADEVSRGKAFDLGSEVKPQLPKCETNIQAIPGHPDTELRNEVQPSPVAAGNPKASDDTEPISRPYESRLSFFSLKEINSCIMASENTRAFCSVMIAVLAVLSHISLPRTIVKSRSIIASRPLYVLLLTDVTIVIARLALEKRRGFEKADGEEQKDAQEDAHNWAGAVKVLEMGLVLHQTIRAIFIDCSFYLAIVICGLSLI
ncbi:hypothetical protein RJ639_037792 [Escallonia herrerae]|uniref:Uncharacterized protein n=1 Tax=Escallonia herrerae TaxID=1293975 RepID=A0AA88WMD2_9ASTE|nr:hypothetical protein RJ639_037792 [Escallonia herrerae]